MARMIPVPGDRMCSKLAIPFLHPMRAPHGSIASFHSGQLHKHGIYYLRPSPLVFLPLIPLHIVESNFDTSAVNSTVQKIATRSSYFSNKIVSKELHAAAIFRTTSFRKSSSSGFASLFCRKSQAVHRLRCPMNVVGVIASTPVLGPIDHR